MVFSLWGLRFGWRNILPGLGLEALEIGLALEACASFLGLAVL
jgi:hypothetical protein